MAGPGPRYLRIPFQWLDTPFRSISREEWAFVLGKFRKPSIFDVCHESRAEAKNIYSPPHYFAPERDTLVIDFPNALFRPNMMCISDKEPLSSFGARMGLKSVRNLHFSYYSPTYVAFRPNALAEILGIFPQVRNLGFACHGIRLHPCVCGLAHDAPADIVRHAKELVADALGMLPGKGGGGLRDSDVKESKRWPWGPAEESELLLEFSLTSTGAATDGSTEST